MSSDLAGAPHADSYPTLNPPANMDGANGETTNGSLHDAKAGIMNTASSAMDTVSNHPATQSVKDTINNQPMTQSVRNEAGKTGTEFQDLAAARRTPDQPAATGQQLTHYHSMFYRLLSWKNPRATAITFVSTILFIFAARYLNVLRYLFKALAYILGATATAEVVGKTTLGTGFASQMRPKKYYTIRKESLERLLDDVEQLVNFVVIEFQRVVFAENVYATVAAFFAAFMSYFLIKFVPLWGLTLMFTTIIYIAPLIYQKNKEFIDAHLNRASDVVSQQSRQFRDLAAHHTGRATETVRTYAGEYSQKAQQYMGSARNKDAQGTPNSVTADDFPQAPQEEPVQAAEPEVQPEPEPEAA